MAKLVHIYDLSLTPGGKRTQFEYENIERIRLCHLYTIPGTTPHCLVDTEGNHECQLFRDQEPSLLQERN